MLDEWPNELKSRQGPPTRLCGVEVYYDFDWQEIIRHNRTTFPNGQALARRLTAECPDNLTPTLLLTCLNDQDERIHRTDDRFIAIIQVEKYLAQSSADPAVTYLAQQSSAPVTDLGRLSSLAPDDISTLLDTHLNIEALDAWLDRDPAHRVRLVELLERRPDLAREIGTVEVPLADQIRAVSELDSDLIDAFLAWADRMGWPDEIRRPALTAIGATPGGTNELGEALRISMPERLDEIREDAAGYRALIEQESVGETAVQEFIEERPWLVGLEYHKVRGRPPVLRGETDFILDRFDGYYDLLELKSPTDPIVEELAPRSRGRAPSPSNHRLGLALNQALAQAHLYRHILGSMSRESAELYGLPYHRYPVVNIVIGRVADLEDTGRHILTELNLSLSRIQVIPFDTLADRIEGIVSNIEQLLLTDTRNLER